MYTPNNKKLDKLRPEDCEVSAARYLNLKTFENLFCAPESFDTFQPYQKSLIICRFSQILNPLYKN